MTGSTLLADQIVQVAQTVADFLNAPGDFSASAALNLNVTLEGLRGGIQALPIAAAAKADLNGRLTGIQALLSSFAAGTSGLAAFEVLAAVLALLELLKEKILSLRIKPCIGALTVCVPAPFSTACSCVC